MDKQDLIVLARQAGIRDCTCNGGFGCLEMFAELVESKERDKWMERVHILILGEREGCAKVCEEEALLWPPSRNFTLCAAAIRARGETK